MRYVQRCGAAVLMLLAGGCASFPWESDRAAGAPTPVTAGPFDESLAAQYRELAALLEQDGATEGAAYFRQRAERVVEGERVAPVYPPLWGVPYGSLGELGRAQAYLILYKIRGAETVAPLATAQAQGNFDCWVQAVGEGAEAADRLAACRSRFQEAMAQLETVLASPQSSS